MKTRLSNLLDRLSFGETAHLIFWNLIIVAFLAGTGYMASSLIRKTHTSGCIEDFRVTDPQINALLLLRELKEQGLFDPTTNSVEDFAWIYHGGELRIMVALDSGIYSALACYTEDSTSFLDIQAR